MDLMLDWEAEGDRFSFDDSDRFEEDSLCSWISEPESLCNNWRGWKKQNGVGLPMQNSWPDETSSVTSLVELAAQGVACHIPFEVVEHFYPPIPEQLQLRIAFWSFPENEEDIRLYSCLANGSADEFQKGEHLFKARAVKDALQIGFHLSATVIPPQTIAQAKGAFNVAVVFDRRRVTSCNCTCNSAPSWCAHVVALCLFRIHQATSVTLRAPVSESLSRLHREQLQKFAQYLISELPQQILPTAQRLLDELLSSQQTAINTVCGAPDPTAGPSASELTTWCLDESTLHDNIKKTLVKFCVPSPIVFSDVNYLSSTAPPAAAEWQSLLRPLRGREPEGIWNLLSIVREMYRRSDTNAQSLLEILTDEVLACEQILVWWFNTKVSAFHVSGSNHGRSGGQNSSSSSQHAASSLCDEIVTLWRLAALNPSLSPIQRDDLSAQLKDWHIMTIDKVRKARGSNVAGNVNAVKKSDIEIFSGFKCGIEACHLDWSDYVIQGVTYVDRHHTWRFFGKAQESECRRNARTKGQTPSQVSGARSSDTVVIGRHPGLPKPHDVHFGVINKHADVDSAAQNDGAYSSSSEGFCESDRRDSATRPPDSDSDLGDCDGMRLPRQNLPIGTAQLPKVDMCDFDLAEDNIPMSFAGSSAANACHQNPEQKEKIRKNLVAQSNINGAGSSGVQAGTSGVQAGTSGVQTGVSGVQVGSGGVQAGASGDCGNANKGQSAPSKSQLVKTEHAESQPSSDEYQVYFYDTKARVQDEGSDKKKKSDEPNYFASLKKMENKQDILFARAEALQAHGHRRVACCLAKNLAEEMLANPPDLASDQQPTTGKGKKKKGQGNISSFASTTLAKAAFLASVLLEEADSHHLAFRVGMFGLEMPRPPASSKALEVKLAYQESELVTLLKRIPLGQAEYSVIQDRAEKLRDGKLKSRGEALLPLTLASFIFDSLLQPALSTTCINGNNTARPPSRSMPPTVRAVSDQKLGFEAAVAALGLKANISEAEHPLLCEGTRRQRGDLAIAMLVQYKDDKSKLSKIMDKLLDKEIHHLYKAPSLTSYLSSAAAAAAAAAAAGGKPVSKFSAKQNNVILPAGQEANVPLSMAPAVAPPNPPNRKSPSSGCESDESLREDTPRSSCSTLVARPTVTNTQGSLGQHEPHTNTRMFSSCSQSGSAGATWQDAVVGGDDRAQSLEYLNLEEKFCPMTLGHNGGARPKTTFLNRYNSKDTDSSAVEEEGDSSDYKAWEVKFRCTNLKTFKKHSVGMAAIDSSAPETTSSDNSPTLVRRSWGKHQGPGSDSGSSGKSSDSLGSSSSGDKAAAAAKLRDQDSPPGSFSEMRYAPQHLLMYSRSSTPNLKAVRYKKNRNVPTVPNQPSEAQAHFMFEAAKTVLTKAGGNSSTSLFTQPQSNNNPTGPHRALHLCAFQIGLYALGLHNCVSPNWLSRTYSSHVSWITGQAMEIGSAAINILIDTWEGHLTPQEVASLADRASRGRDPNMVRAASELALSCLPHAQALNPNEIQRALIQCKEQSQEMLERACLAVESAAKGGGVYPEVLFDVAKRWYELYEEALQGPNAVHVALRPDLDEVQAVIQVPGNVQGPESQSPPLMQLVPAGPVQCVPTSIAVTAVAVAAHPGGLNGQLPPGTVVAAPIPYSLPPPATSQMPHHPYIAPYSYVQQVPPNFAHHYSAPHIPLHTHNMHPSYMSTYPYNSQQAATFTNIAQLQSPATLYHANISHLRPPPPTVQVAFPAQQLAHGAAVVQGKLTVDAAQQLVAAGPGAVLVQQVAPPQHPPVLQQQQQQQLVDAQQPEAAIPPPNSTHVNYLLAAYRVGMLAMETLARRVHDDRPQTKYSRNPPYGEEVKWLHSISMKLGSSYLQQFAASAVNAVVSPFVLHDIAVEAAHYLARNNTAQLSQHLRSPTLNSLVQKCLQMFTQCAHQRLHHIVQADYDEFVSIVCSARNAFCMTQGGMVQFNELLQSLRRSKSCKKELWQRIINGLSTGNI